MSISLFVYYSTLVIKIPFLFMYFYNFSFILSILINIIVFYMQKKATIDVAFFSNDAINPYINKSFVFAPTFTVFI